MNNKKADKGWATVQDGAAVINGVQMKIPNLKLLGELGRGANAVVFEAVDEMLGRGVAVKVWNAVGAGRAQPETAKIARLSHPLIVSTYLFQHVGEHPYCVMELVRGESAKSWLKKKPSLAHRVLVWELYSRSMRFVHAQGEIHGDPHLGNVLVFEDVGGAYGHNTPSGETPLGIKLADTGTSVVWTDRRKILNREADIILETATRLFPDIDLGRLWVHPPGLTYRETLHLLDVLVRYLSMVHLSLEDYDRRSENADMLVAAVLETPLFELDEVVRNARQRGFTTGARFARRLNQKLMSEPDLLEADDAIGSETVRLYEAKRKIFLQSLRPN